MAESKCKGTTKMANTQIKLTFFTKKLTNYPKL